MFVRTYHNAGANGDTSAAICVWHYVTKTDGEKRNRNKPHRIEKVSVFFVVKPELSINSNALLIDLPSSSWPTMSVQSETRNDRSTQAFLRRRVDIERKIN